MSDMLTELAGQLPHKLAIIDDRPEAAVTTWTFAALEANANRLARLFIDCGVQERMRIASCGQNSAWLVACTHAARKVGAVGVPLNYRLTEEEAAYVVDDSDAEIAFVDAAYAPLFRAIAPKTPKLRCVLVFDGEPLDGQHNAIALMQQHNPDPPEVAHAGDSMSMIYTSGTTGKPKGAFRSGVGDPNQAAALLAHIGYRPDDIYLTTGPLYHSGPGGFLALAQRLGNTAVVQHKFDAEDWLRLVDRYKATSTFAAPTPIRRVCQLPDDIFSRYDVNSMRIMVANAAPWSFALKRMYLERFPAHSLFEVYGSTELGVNTVLRPEDQLRKPGSCGKPAPGVTITLYDEHGAEVTEPGKEGELYVRTANAFQTYHNAHDKYLADRRGDMQTVGDVAYRDEEGFIFICDRKKDMIISGGMNIYPAEIEAVLDQHPNILDAAVFGIPSEEWGESVHAVVVVRPGTKLSDDDIMDYARARLASYKAPRSISRMEEIPRTGSGKILKRELRKPFWDGFSQRV